MFLSLTRRIQSSVTDGDHDQEEAGRRRQPRPERSTMVTPSYGPGNSLNSATDCLSAQDIENYFRIMLTHSISSRNSLENSLKTATNSEPQKAVQYLRPTSFEQQQKEMQKLKRTSIDIIPYATFHEKSHFSFLFVLLNEFFILFV